MVQIGKPVAKFELPATGGKTLSLGDFKGKTLVLYFYPKDNTPGCTREGQDFRDAHEAFRATGAEIVGVSRDSVKIHENFCAKNALPFDLIADTEESLCKQFDVIKEKNMYGRKYMGVERSTFVIDGDGVLRAEWRKVKVPGHVDEVLETVQSLAA
jgi:peroxiredoxin Q/BCP